MVFIIAGTLKFYSSDGLNHDQGHVKSLSQVETIQIKQVNSPVDKAPKKKPTEKPKPEEIPTNELQLEEIVSTEPVSTMDTPTDTLSSLPSNLIPFKNAAVSNFSVQLLGQEIHLATCHSIFTPKLTGDTAIDSTPLNTVFIFTGRWFFLRIQLPQLFRELRSNGGIIDKVWFILIQWKKSDLAHLKKFAKTANKVLQDEVFVFHDYQDYNIHMKKPYTYAYCEILANLLKYPSNRYFKIDDDVVYIHPHAFNTVVENKIKHKPSCLINMFNTAGGNWMCNKMYQDNGALKEVPNPDLIDFHKVGGEGNIKSTNYSLDLFLHFQKANQLDKIFIDSMFWNSRYTMNAAMFDSDSFDFDIVKKAGPLKHDKDEPWWTNEYPKASGGNRSNCLTGNTVIVHFSHSGGGLALKLIKLGLLDKFEKLVLKQKKENIIKMDDELWGVLEYSS